MKSFFTIAIVVLLANSSFAKTEDCKRLNGAYEKNGWTATISFDSANGLTLFDPVLRVPFVAPSLPHYAPARIGTNYVALPEYVHSYSLACEQGALHLKVGSFGRISNVKYQLDRNNDLEIINLANQEIEVWKRTAN